MDGELPSNRNQVTTLYSGDLCAYSHRTRILLAEKDISVEVDVLNSREIPEDVYAYNPDNNMPVLVDRDLVLYNSTIIMEYLDERFPHPSLMPVDPAARAKTRLMLYRLDSDWYRAVDVIEGSPASAAADKARQRLLEGLITLGPLFAQDEFIMGDTLTLADCSLMAVMWRLPALGVSLPKTAAPALDYARRMFSRRTFQASLTDAERELANAA